MVLFFDGIMAATFVNLEADKRMPDSVLFRVQQVEVVLSEFDLPGPTRRKVSCSRCGQIVRDHREVVVNGADLCRPCAQGAYYKNGREITWPDMNWAPLPADSRQITGGSKD